MKQIHSSLLMHQQPKKMIASGHVDFNAQMGNANSANRISIVQTVSVHIFSQD